jgi:putative proteasome-type protease
VLDRLLSPETTLPNAAKCALVSMDSTMKSNLSVGLPIDLAVYREGALSSQDVMCIDEQNPYYSMVHAAWGERLRVAFDGLETPTFGEASGAHPLCVASARHHVIKKITRPDERIV